MSLRKIMFNTKNCQVILICHYKLYSCCRSLLFVTYLTNFYTVILLFELFLCVNLFQLKGKIYFSWHGNVIALCNRNDQMVSKLFWHTEKLFRLYFEAFQNHRQKFERLWCPKFCLSNNMI